MEKRGGVQLWRPAKAGCLSLIKLSQAQTDHGIKDQAEVAPVLKGALQLDAVPPPQLVRICQLAQNPLLRLQAEERGQS